MQYYGPASGGMTYVVPTGSVPPHMTASNPSYAMSGQPVTFVGGSYMGQPVAVPRYTQAVPQGVAMYGNSPQGIPRGSSSRQRTAQQPQQVQRSSEEPNLGQCGQAMDIVCNICDAACAVGAVVAQAACQACSYVCGYASRPDWEYRPEYVPLAQRSYDVGGNEYEVMVYRRRKGWCE